MTSQALKNSCFWCPKGCGKSLLRKRKGNIRYYECNKCKNKYSKKELEKKWLS